MSYDAFYAAANVHLNVANRFIVRAEKAMASGDADRAALMLELAKEEHAALDADMRSMNDAARLARKESAR